MINVLFITLTLTFFTLTSAFSNATPLQCPSNLCQCSLSEMVCTKANIEKIAWEFPSNLSRISLADNNLSEVSASSFKHAAPTLVSLDLSHNNLSLLPSQLLAMLKEITFLNISHNQIDIEFAARGGPLIENTKLRTLDLSHNRIQFIAPFLVQRLGDLEHLYLDGNRLTHFWAYDFADSPKLSTISLSNNNIKAITFGVHSKFKKLDLSRNAFHFTNVSHDFESSPHMEELRIGHPGLKYYQKTFAGMKFLHKVELLDFSQSTLTSELFRFSNILRTVDVTEGSLQRASFSNHKDFKSLTFTNLPNMTSLFVSSCPRFGLGSLKFTNCPQISNVKLNGLGYIYFNSSETFFGVNAVKNLNLSKNSIERLVTGMFDNLLDLEILDLSHNRIGSVQNEAILPLTKLQVLNLRGNILLSVSSRFLKSESLLSLDLSYNLIKRVLKDALILLPKVATVDLSFNYITDIPPITKSSLALNLEGIESWDCTCELFDFVTSKDVVNSCKNTTKSWCYICKTPAEYARMSVLSLQRHCEDQSFPLWMIISIACLAVVLVASIVIALLFWRKGICKTKRNTPTRIPSYYTPPQQRANNRISENTNTYSLDNDLYNQSPAKLVRSQECGQSQCSEQDLTNDESTVDEVFVVACN